ncbi:MAG: SDR family NAD(P)-dependent oxidoreductase [Acidimicrobiia bacterium]
MESLQNKTAVITGAASGIGRAFAERFSAAGMNIVLADIDASSLHVAAQAIEARGAGALAVTTDVSDASSVEALRDAALDRFGAVHLVCNNAGVGDRSETIEEWEWVMGVNFWGVVHGMRTFLPLLVEQDEGHMVNTSSMSGLMPAYGSYAASKFAVLAITEGAYYQLGNRGSKVGLSCLCPGFVQTQIGRSERSRPDWAGRDDEPTDAARARVAMIQHGTDTGIPPAAVADLVHDAVVARRFWVFPHPDRVTALRPRFEAILNGENPPLLPTVDANGL